MLVSLLLAISRYIGYPLVPRFSPGSQVAPNETVERWIRDYISFARGKFNQVTATSTEE